MAENMPEASASATASVSAGIAAASAHQPRPPEPAPHPSSENGGRSLAEMAHIDLDAALQLLAERAHYITAASGAAIALRRGEHNDMLCRASAGTNAPELGALLSMDYGLSGESVRTRQVLRCDDAERDPRVNHEVCRQLGIASVVVMPIVSDDQVLGVFEILSGKPRAFEERDLSALRRLSEMVEVAVKHAVAAQALLPFEEPGADPAPAAATVGVPEHSPPPTPTANQKLSSAASEAVLNPPEPKSQELTKDSQSLKPTPEKPERPFPKKPLFWSAATTTRGSSSRTESADSAVPPMLRTLQKCQACGFPVSQGRSFCVECEEKQWRGQRLSHPSVATPNQPVEVITHQPPLSDSQSNLAAAELATASDIANSDIATNPPPTPQHVVSERSDLYISVPFLASAIESESWFAANKYILAVLVAVAIIIVVIVAFH